MCSSRPVGTRPQIPPPHARQRGSAVGAAKALGGRRRRIDRRDPDILEEYTRRLPYLRVLQAYRSRQFDNSRSSLAVPRGSIDESPNREPPSTRKGFHRWTTTRA